MEGFPLWRHPKPSRGSFQPHLFWDSLKPGVERVRSQSSLSPAQNPEKKSPLSLLPLCPITELFPEGKTCKFCTPCAPPKCSCTSNPNLLRLLSAAQPSQSPGQPHTHSFVLDQVVPDGGASIVLLDDVHLDGVAILSYVTFQLGGTGFPCNNGAARVSWEQPKKIRAFSRKKCS